MNKLLVIPYFISMKGCVYNCIYCNQNALKEHGAGESLHEIVQKYMNFSKNYEALELAFYGGTFLNLPEKTLLSLLDQANDLKAKGIINSIRISTTPDSVTYRKASIIRGLVNTVELGVQTLDNRILKLLRRKYDVSQCIEKTGLLKEMGFNLGYQLMLGLPTQTCLSFKKTIDIVSTVKPDFIRLYPLIVLKNTPIENYIKLGVTSYCNLDDIFSCGAYALLECYKRHIKVIRVGLTEFFDEKQIYMGYMIENWRIMIESFLWRCFLKEIFRNKGKDIFIVNCNLYDYDSIVGVKKQNINFFKNMGIELKVFKSPDMDKFSIELGGKKYFLLEFDANLVFI